MQIVHQVATHPHTTAQASPPVQPHLQPPPGFLPPGSFVVLQWQPSYSQQAVQVQQVQLQPVHMQAVHVQPAQVGQVQPQPVPVVVQHSVLASQPAAPSGLVVQGLPLQAAVQQGAHKQPSGPSRYSTSSTSRCSTSPCRWCANSDSRWCTSIGSGCCWVWPLGCDDDLA